MKTIKSIDFMPNGNTVVFDQDDQQIGELQESWFLLYVSFLKRKGISGEQIENIQINGPGGSFKYISKHNNW